MTTTEIIKAIEAKGYSVVSEENMYLGTLDESCPIVYSIYNPDCTRVYGSNGVSPKNLEKWLNLPDIKENESEVYSPKNLTASEEASRKAKEREFDNLYNEGAEGYNPYR